MALKKRGSHDLRLQLLAFYLLFVGPIFALILVFYLSAGQRLRQDVTAADLSLARAIALETDAMLLKAKAAVEAFAVMPEVIQADSAAMESLFAAGAAARQDINLFYRLSADGTMLYHYPSGPGSTVGQDFSFREYFQAARLTQDHVFSKGRISPTTGRPVATSVMPVFIDGHFDGVVATNLELERLTETVRRIGLKQPHSRGVEIIIVDATGQVISHSKSESLLENLRSAPEGDGLPGVEEVLSGREGSLMGKDRWGAEWLVTYTPVPSAGWGVIVQHPARLAFASLQSFQRGLILALVFFGLGAVYFWGVLSRRVINPLEKLTRYGEGVGQGTVEAELDREAVLPISQRLDQIGHLTRALLRAERYIRLRLLELTTLHKTSTAVASTLDTQQVISKILDEVQRLLQVRQCALLVMNDVTQVLEIRASRGLSQSYPARLKLDEARRQLPAERAIAWGQPVEVPDIEADPNFAPLLPLAQAEGFRSLLAIPLTTPHVPPAALVIYRAEVHHFSRQEIDLAASFANYAAIALEHATLFSLTDAELEKRVRFLSALNRVAHTVSQSLVFEEVLNNAMEAVLEVMHVDACWIYLRREMEDFLRLRAQRGLPSHVAERLNAQKVTPGQGFIGRVAERGQPLLLEGEALQGAQWSGDPLIAGGRWSSVVAAPLLAKETTIGVLGMASESDRPFSEVETELLQAIGDQIAIAVINARLYRRSREAAILEERNRVAREIHDTLAQGFTGILVQLQATERLSLKHPEKARQSLQEARDLARESLQEARRSVLNLRPTVLENLTLDEAIARQVARFEAKHHLNTRFRLEGYPSPLNPDVEQNLYRITQEALTNASRHAQAKNVTVTLRFAPDTVTLAIADDGIGLNGQANGRGRDGEDGRGFGLVSIRERAKLIEGRITFETPASGGTRIEVVIPK
ncbi:MAG: GAF domain-containing protein [Anaerolineae bacterium]